MRPTVESMQAFDFAHRSGIGMVAGVAGGCRETWDFDDLETYQTFVDTAESCELGELVARIRGGYEDTTPGGGRRWIVTYPETVEWKDCTLARRPGREGEPKTTKTLIELPRFAIIAPSNGGTHPTGRPYVRLSGGFDTIARYSVEERDALIQLARSFDQMPKKAQRAPVTPKTTTAGSDLRPGDDYAQRTSWAAVLEPAGWVEVFTRGDVSYWRRPEKTFGISATTNFGGADLFYVFSSSTEFEPETSYTKFGAYALLEHRGDYGKAALALAKKGYGEQDDTPLPVSAQTEPIAPRTLDETIATFRRWLYLEDPSSVYAVAATLVANRAPGDPVWLLLVCAPSTGKTEVLSAAQGLSWVIPAAKVTEASLLSGTSRREKVSTATGGLLRQVGDFGVLLIKDFTSVLAQNKDARAEAMAALREVYDGDWHRPVGTDGGKVLTWRGKCGLIGGVTPALDQYGQVTSALGDRFVLLRMPDADVDAFGLAALHHGDHERDMRRELSDALAGLVEHADIRRVNVPRLERDQHRLIALAAYTARARTPVVRDGYRQDILYLPQVEGPGRLVKAYARFLGGLEAIGCDSGTAWGTLTRVAVDCAPALRTKVVRELVQRSGPARTSEIARSVETATKTASRYLEDLSILRMATREKLSAADNSPDLWSASAWLRQYWPEANKSKTDKYPPAHKTTNKGDSEKRNGIHPRVLLSPTSEDVDAIDSEVFDL